MKYINFHVTTLYEQSLPPDTPRTVPKSSKKAQIQKKVPDGFGRLGRIRFGRENTPFGRQNTPFGRLSKSGVNFHNPKKSLLKKKVSGYQL